MRVAPVALVPGLDPVQRSGAAQLQSALTHGHPTALAASDLTMQAICLLAQGTEPGELVGRLREYARANRSAYRADWLGDLAEHGHDPDPVSFIARGFDECLAALDRLDAALASPDPDADPCLATGAGWIAEEALATAVYCFLLLADDPPAVVRRAAYSSGDSDSIAALAGAFAGAYHGADGWPAEWAAAIEYRERLLALGTAWDA
jgi:ADP-ribosylglycohydrolase